MRLQDLFRFQGTVGRAAYLLTGVTGLLIKHPLDRVLALQVYPQP